MTAYGKANWTNVRFNFELALQCARDLHTLAGDIDTKQASRAGLAPDAEKDWTGPHHETFRSKIGVEDSDAGTMVTECKALATKFAEAWAHARGEQDRRNFGRYVEKQEEQESGWDHFTENFTGDDDYGAPPSDPPVPGPPGFSATRAPQHSEYGP